MGSDHIDRHIWRWVIVTSVIGAIIRRDLRTLSSPRDSQCNNLYDLCPHGKGNSRLMKLLGGLTTKIYGGTVTRLALGSRREAFLSQNIRTCICSFTLNPAFHQNSKIFSYNLALPLIYCWPKQHWPLTIDPIENTDKKSQNWEMPEGLCMDLGLVWTWSCLQA